MLALLAIGFGVVVGPTPVGPAATRPAAGAAGEEGREALFEPAGAVPGAAMGRGDETPALRSRLVRVREGALGALGRGGATVVINAFDDAAMTVEVRSDSTVDGSRLITGRIAGEAGSSVLLVQRAGAPQGDIRSPAHGAMEIRFVCADARGGVHIVRRLDESGYKACGTGPAQHVHAEQGPGDPAAPPPPLRGPTRIDVMIVYTAQAQAGAGGEAAIEALADLAVSQANQVYINSGVGVELHLVYRGLVNYAESGSAGTDLGALRNPADGLMDEVHCIRNVVGADMVALLVNNFDACGIGYLMVNVNSGFAPYAFTVTDKDCIGGYTFSHELGHNMGCNHDRANAGMNSSFPYAYGYRTPDNVYRTIMAYAPGTRAPYFSNPDLTYQGYVLGVPLGQTGETDNALAINNTRATTAAFRGQASGADYDHNGVITPADVATFVNAWLDSLTQGTLVADFDGNGAVQPADVAVFVGAWFGALAGGC